MLCIRNGINVGEYNTKNKFVMYASRAGYFDTKRSSIKKKKKYYVLGFNKREKPSINNLKRKTKVKIPGLWFEN